MSCLLIAIQAGAELPRNNPVPGGIAVIPLSDSLDEKPLVRYGQKVVWIDAEEGIWFALVGIAQETLPGKYLITIEHQDHSRYGRSFRIHPLAAVQEQGTIVLPKSASDIGLEALDPPESIATDTGNEDNLSAIDYRFQQIVSSGSYIPYGRVLRDENSPTIISHPWITYLTEPDEIVRAPAPGTVKRVYISDNGNVTTEINHHNGLSSLIGNLGQTILKPGQFLQTGEPIGTTSAQPERKDKEASGRVDWYLFLNETLIDPLKLTPSA